MSGPLLRIPVSCACAALLIGAAQVGAADVHVSPVLVQLSPSAPSTLITLRNAAAEPVSFEVHVRAWKQSPAGEMDLSATRDLIAFPPIVPIGPGERRNVRIGVTGKPYGPLEKSYRVFFQEMPSAQKAGGPSHVRLLTRIGVPVFVAPIRTFERTAIEGMAARAGKFSFDLHNKGSVHVRPESIKVSAISAGGKTLFEKDLLGWYVLAASERKYEVEVPADVCTRVRALNVEVVTTGDPIRSRLATPEGACAL